MKNMLMLIPPSPPTHPLSFSPAASRLQPRASRLGHLPRTILLAGGRPLTDLFPRCFFGGLLRKYGKIIETYEEMFGKVWKHAQPYFFFEHIVRLLPVWISVSLHDAIHVRHSNHTDCPATGVSNLRRWASEFFLYPF